MDSFWIEDFQRRFRAGRSYVPPIPDALPQSPAGEAELRQIPAFASGLQADDCMPRGLPLRAMPLYCFVHIPKAAGTSLIEVMADAYGRFALRYELLVEQVGSVPRLRQLVTASPGFLDRTALIMGHFTIRNPLVRLARRRPVFLSVLRDPVARAVSLYDYVRRAPAHPLHEEIRTRTLLDAVMNSRRFRRVTINEQLLQLFGSAEREAIEARLASHSHVIGRMDRLPEFLDVMCEVLGIESPGAPPRRNIGDRSGPPEPAAHQADYREACAVLAEANRAEFEFLERLSPVLTTMGARRRLVQCQAAGPIEMVADRPSSEGTTTLDERKMPVSHDAVLWALRLIIGREPANAAEIALHQQHPSLESLRRTFVNTPEFKGYYAHVTAQDAYRAPLFLLQPPADPAIAWRFTPPGLKAPVSQLCTGGQLRDAVYAEWCARLDLAPNFHRKPWEFAYIAAAMQAAGLLVPGTRALGFGVGMEPLPALLARHGASVVATDAPVDVIEGQGWGSTGQHATGLDALDRPQVVSSEELRRRVTFRPVDMNHIPADLRDFDVCWSSCALEHLGSIKQGSRFIEQSLRTLRPGGYAIHTTEFNMSSNTETFESPALSLFRKQDIEALASQLTAAGHQVMPLNFHPGDCDLDVHIDLPPYALPHLKLQVANYVTTSIGLIVRKAV